MINIIKKYLKIYDELTKTYSIRILSCAVTFSIILMIIPLMMIVNIILNRIGINTNIIYTYQMNGLLPSIIFIINLFWTTSTLMVTFNQIGDTIYHNVDKRSYIKMRIKSFLTFMLLILFIIGIFCFIVVIDYFISKTKISSVKYLLMIFEFIGEFVSIWLIIGFIYKKLIPVKIKLKYTLSTSLIITLIWYFLTNVVFPIIEWLIIDNYIEIYQTYAYVFLLFYYLYIMSYVFICGIIFHYFLYLKKNKKESFSK